MPRDRTVFTGDIVFSTAIRRAWAGPISNWIKACDLIIGLGRRDDRARPRADRRQEWRCKDFKAYFEYITREAKKRYDAGMGVVEAACDIDLEPFDGWLDAERIIVNVNTLYKEFGAVDGSTMTELRGAMWKFRNQRQAKDTHGHDGHSH